MTEKELISKGYNKSEALNSTALNLFQRKIKDYIGVKYFISIYQYQSDNNPFKIEVKLQFESSLSTINITLFSFIDNKSIEELEEYIDELWERLEGHYYEKF
jgi:hypothetical protein